MQFFAIRALRTVTFFFVGLCSLGGFTGCNNPQYEAGTVKVEPRGEEAEPATPRIDTSTRDSSEGGPR